MHDQERDDARNADDLATDIRHFSSTRQTDVRFHDLIFSGIHIQRQLFILHIRPLTRSLTGVFTCALKQEQTQAWQTSALQDQPRSSFGAFPRTRLEDTLGCGSPAPLSLDPIVHSPAANDAYDCTCVRVDDRPTRRTR